MAELIRAADLVPTVTPQGQLIRCYHELLPAAAVEAGAALAIGRVEMKKWGISNVHRHLRDWVYVAVVKGRAWTVTGDELTHAFVCGVGDLLVIPPGEPHVAIAFPDSEVFALEIRTGAHRPVDFGDVEPMPELQDRAEQLAVALQAGVGVK